MKPAEKHTPAELRAYLEGMLAGCLDDDIYRAALTRAIAASARVEELEGPARRLARSIFRDIRRYWPETFAESVAFEARHLADVIEEGRLLFTRRIASAELAGIYAQELPAGLRLSDDDRERLGRPSCVRFETAVAALYPPAKATEEARCP